jgi:hypothetical protein
MRRGIPVSPSAKVPIFWGAGGRVFAVPKIFFEKRGRGPSSPSQAHWPPSAPATARREPLTRRERSTLLQLPVVT